MADLSPEVDTVATHALFLDLKRGVKKNRDMQRPLQKEPLKS